VNEPMVMMSGQAMETTSRYPGPRGETACSDLFTNNQGHRENRVDAPLLLLGPCILQRDRAIEDGTFRQRLLAIGHKIADALKLEIITGLGVG